MLFSGIPFLYYFLPAVLILYFLSPKKLKNCTLLLSSLFFYAWGEPKYVVLMVGSILQGYLFARLIERSNKQCCKRIYLISSVLVSLGLLGYFKYANFFVENFSALTGLSLSALNIALPIGISFYTFQILSYVVDVYRGTVGAQKSIIKLGAYISMFPQLIAGPIVRYSDIESQLSERTHSVDRAAEGIRRFIIGLSKKVLLANTLGEIVAQLAVSTDVSVLYFWLYAVAFALQIYFDFSGYSDMAIGLGKIFGFDFMENFNYPYISGSITEFWRRWHISLGSWFRDYVYIPLGGNRVGKFRHIFNILVVWMLTGFWHGADWNFVIWGLFFAVLLVLEKFFLGRFLEKTRVIKHAYVLVLVAISFVIFNATSMMEAGFYLSAMFFGKGYPLVSSEFVYLLKQYGSVLILACIGATPLVKNGLNRAKKNEKIAKILNVAEPLVLAGLLLLCTAYLVDGSFNPFLYFRF